MTEKEWQQAMTAAVTETLENMAFMEIQGDTGELTPIDDPVWVTLLVHEPAPGEFRLVLPKALLAAMAGNVYGPTAQLGEQQLRDLLAELLNTMAGRFLGRILPGEAFRLGIPQAGKGAPPPADPHACHWRFLAEELPLSLTASGAPLLQRRPA